MKVIKGMNQMNTNINEFDFVT